MKSEPLSKYDSVSVLSPCKLNLFLYITGRRPDGYHNLQTLFTLLNYGDTMTFRRKEAGDNSITLSGPFDFPVEKNSIYKAAVLLQQAAGKKFGVHIDVIKRIPQGGGLGGGSSNAATTMLVLNRMFDLNLPKEELLKLGAKLGADVPVFIYGRSAFAEGIGEILQPVDVPERWYVVLTPPCQVSTVKAFSDPDLKRDTPARPLSELLREPYGNDFTCSVTKNYPAVGHSLELLVKYAPSHLSGSGSSCFAAFDTQEQALKACAELRAQNAGQVFAACSLARSSVADL